MMMMMMMMCIKMGLALNNLQWLICHKNQTKPIEEETWNTAGEARTSS